MHRVFGLLVGSRPGLLAALLSGTCSGLIVSIPLGACGGNGTAEDDHPMEGTWTGDLDCSATINRSGDIRTESGTQPFELRFDSRGNLLLTLGGEARPLEEEGQVITTQESDGSIVQTTVVERTITESGAVYVVDSVSDDTETDVDGNFSLHTEQRLSLDFDLNADGKSGSVTVDITTDETNTAFAAGESFFEQTLSELSCTGELT